MKRHASNESPCKDQSAGQPQKISPYFNQPLSDVSLKVSNASSVPPISSSTLTTPESKKVSKLEESGLLSPDEIPPTPTPPAAKRPRLGDKEASSFTKLKPRSIISDPSKIAMDQATASNPKLEDLKLSNRLPQMVQEKPAKKDFYKLGRHKVIESSLMESGRERRLVVEPQDDSCRTKRICMLRDFWLNTAVEVGDIVHIQADWYETFDENFEAEETAILDRQSGLLIVRPDLLISGTSVVSSLFCPRKAVLSERFKGTDPTNKAMLTGTIVHKLLQKVLMERDQSTADLKGLVDSFLRDPSTLHDLYAACIPPEELKGEVLKYVPTVGYFVDKFVLGKDVPPPGGDGRAKQPAGRWSKPAANPSWDGRIESVCDIEENMWSPWLGIKGKVDLTVKAKLNGRATVKMPLELKTGRPSFSDEHKGQVTLYTMMMNRSKTPGQGDPAGLLLYLKDGCAIQSISAGIREKQGLIQLRNDMVRYITARTTTSDDGQVIEGPLPGRIDRIQACASCPLQVECTIYQEAETAGQPANGPLPQQLEATGHLSPAHKEYFLEWSRMLRLEWEESQSRSRSLSSIWCVDPRVRQAQGSCLSHLRIETSLPSQCPSELSQYNIQLVPMNGEPLPGQLSFQTGDNVVLSTEAEVAVATGCLVDIGPRSVTIATDRNVANWDRSYEALHLDKLEYQGGQSLLYSNLSRLMANNDRAARLRSFVIDRKVPTFLPGLRRSEVEQCTPILYPLNNLQRRAVLKALTCEDYCLIKGLPGTGKTSLIVALIRLAVLLGKSVLLTSYTHSAVDNVLLKLMGHQVDFVRIGREHRTHPSILPYSAEVKSRSCRSVEDIERLYSAPVIAATCLSVGHPALIRRQFDLCIVDEAAQALQLAVIGPLTAARRFVLVGDPLQLPPVVQSRKAKSMGMDESLFVRLSGVAPSSGAVVPLHEQYRMCGPINALANALTYGGDLQCGNEGIERAQLPLPDLDSVRSSWPEWLFRVIQPGILNALVFLDTSLLSEELKGHTSGVSPLNRLEANLAERIVKALKDGGLPYDQMGIIAPYQSQVQHLRQTFAGTDELEINTVDQYQGRDKEAVLYSCTKSEPADKLDEEDDGQRQTILHDLRRLTVAVTRAKHKLIILGDSATLRRFPPFAKLLGALEAHQLYQLCPGRDGFSSSCL